MAGIPYFQAITLPSAEGTGIATKEADESVEHLVTGEGKEVAAGGKGVVYASSMC